jgi:3-oxoacyl-[acyl-carrier-protein] synthase-3
MAFLSHFGSYLPQRVMDNADLASRLGVTADWILDVSGIEERRVAGDDESVTDMAVQAANDCLAQAGLNADQLGLILVASGTHDRCFPGPACTVAARLGLKQTPALDIPMASAGALFAMALASRLTAVYGRILVVASEKMSAICMREPLDRNVAILFGDGAGACLVSDVPGPARIVDSVLHSDGNFAADLRLSHEGWLEMNGRSVIMQASRKIPAGIKEVLERNQTLPSEVEIFLMHQANQNLIDKMARTLNVPTQKFFSNIARYGNTSSASMLIAAAEWWSRNKPSPGAVICFAAFGAGFHWGALLATCV